MIRISYPLKVLLIATVISLLPVTLGVSPLDYKGNSLEAAEDEKKKKKKRRRTKLPSKKMQRILQTIVPFIEAEQWEEALLALEPVAVIDSKFTSTDRSKMYYYQGYIFFSKEQYGLAETAYKNLMAEEDSTDQERLGALYSLSQLSYIAEDYKSAINYLLEWLELEELPSSDGYGLLAQAYYQIEDFQKSVEAIDTAINIQESQDIKIKVPVLDAEGNETGEMIETGETRKGVAKENHYLLKMALYSELKKDLEVLPIYEILVQYYPKKRYWTNLSGLYGQRDRQMDQMGALEAAYDDRLLDKQREFTALSQLLFMFENPRKAARVIEDGLYQGIVKKEEKTLKAAAQYWHASKELEKAKPYYEKAAIKSKEGELYIFLGQVHFSLDEFSDAENAIRLGIKKGKLKDEAAAYMLLGQINFENQKWNSAIEAFRKCIDVAEKQFDDKKKKQKEKKKRVQDQARKWVTYTEGEEERVEALKLKRKALGV
jgi:uncharacterized protein HemY